MATVLDTSVSGSACDLSDGVRCDRGARERAVSQRYAQRVGGITLRIGSVGRFVETHSRPSVARNAYENTEAVRIST